MLSVKTDFPRHFLPISDRKARVFYASSTFLQALFTYQVMSGPAMGVNEANYCGYTSLIN